MATDYYKSGILQSETTYKNDEPTGVSKRYYESGKKAIEIPYSKGKVNGKVVYFCENGKQAGSGKFVNGELEGFMESADGVRGNEDFDVIEHYCKNGIDNIERILHDVAYLRTTNKNALNEQRNTADEDINKKYTEDSYGNTDDGLGGGGGGIATKAKESIKTPSEHDIIISSGSEFRSIADIMKVVRQRTPGLRHIYTKFLKKKPRFQGKVTLKLTIAPADKIISISIVSSTTGYEEFDNEIQSAVSRWKFSKVKSGKTMVNIPFTFSE